MYYNPLTGLEVSSDSLLALDKIVLSVLAFLPYSQPESRFYVKIYVSEMRTFLLALERWLLILLIVRDDRRFDSA